MDLIKKLEEYRLKERITQERLAEMLGVSFCTVNRWLNRKTKPHKIQEYHIKKLLDRNKEKS
ncbi:MAG: helix-turn-helix domain-containing protein [Candidatus Omnitrophota bacterium]|nr:helix-turn-helix domain-containing protein [Candidatus Omnitrophota bacterium]